ncbi:hypothetical protein UT300018_11830 [Clostridium faecium]
MKNIFRFTTANTVNAIRSKIHSVIVFRSILDKNQLIEVIQSLNKVIMYPCFSDEKELKLNFEVIQENISLLIS